MYSFRMTIENCMGVFQADGFKFKGAMLLV